MSLDIWVYMDTGGGDELRSDDLNATHNLIPMWRKAGVFDALYESRGTEACAWADKIEVGIAAMRADPDGFRALNPPNFWGNYEGALEFLTQVAELFRRHPLARIGISR